MPKTVFVCQTGTTPAEPYGTWATAAQSLATALAYAAESGDTVVIAYNDVPTVDSAISADTVYTAANNISIIAASKDGTGTAYTPAEMGASAWIGNASTNRSLTIAGGYNVYCYGITLRTAGATSDDLTISTSDNAVNIYEKCYLWHGNTNSSSAIIVGNTTDGRNSLVILKDTKIRFGNVGQTIDLAMDFEMYEGSISADGSAPTELFGTPVSGGGTTARVFGADLSHVGGASAASLVANCSNGNREFFFTQCLLGENVAPFATQTATNQSSLVGVTIQDCAYATGSNADKHYMFGFHNPLGSLVVEPSKYVTSDGAQWGSGSADRCTWKIVTTANATYANPFVTPWLSKFHAGTSQITPRIEVMRTGTNAVDGEALNDDELWAEFAVKATSGSTKATIYNDRRTLNAAAAAQATSALTASDWTGESTYSWFGKLEPAAPITPAEIGDLSVRFCVANDVSASSVGITVYIDPTIRGTV